MIWTAPKLWLDETCFILAGGPSLKGFDAGVLRGHGRVISINDSWRIAPWADILYCCDQPWIEDQTRSNRASIDGSVRFRDLLATGFWVKGGDSPKTDPRIHILRFSGQVGLETNPEALRTGNNSGYQAINLAYHFGAARIVLLGYDMHCDGAKTHWHDGPRAPASEFGKTLGRDMVPYFEYLVAPLAAADVEVVNATPGSALKCWPMMSLEEALTKEKVCL